MKLRPQDFERFHHQEDRPDEGFEEAQHTHPEGGGGRANPNWLGIATPQPTRLAMTVGRGSPRRNQRGSR